MKKLVLLGAFVALADPALLFLVWQYFGGWAMLGLLILPPMIGGRLVASAKQRLINKADAGINTPGLLGEGLLLTAAGFLFLYPGPLSTLLGLLLLVPGLRRLIQGWARDKFKNAVSAGSVTVMPMGGAVFTSAVGPGGDPVGPTPPLKRAEGQVIDEPAMDDQRQLPEAKND